MTSNINIFRPLFCIQRKQKPERMDNNFYRACSCSLTELNIVDYETRYQRYLYRRVPTIKCVLKALEALTRHSKLVMDNNDIDYDMYPMFYILKDLTTRLPRETDIIWWLMKVKRVLFTRNLLGISQTNLLSEYTGQMKVILNTPLMSQQLEDLVRKFVKVCHVLQLQPELSIDNIHQYEFMAELLKLCYNANLQDSKLVMSLLRLTIEQRVLELYDTRHALQPLYAQDFFRYVLEHATKEKFDLGRFCRRHPRSLWEYSRNYSVIQAVSFGNVGRTLDMLQHGFEVFPGSEVSKSSHGYFFIDETMPPLFLMIIKMMCSMRSVQLLTLRLEELSHNGLYSVTSDQEKCFRLIWRTIGQPYVKSSEMALAVSTEYFYLALHAILNPIRYRNNMKFSQMYEDCFPDLASGHSTPRSLKHLCRCTIRKNLRVSWNLPGGIFKLGLPWLLEDYLNLLID